MKRRTLFVALLVLALLITIVPAVARAAEVTRSPKVVILAPITDKFATLGLSVQRGAQIAFEEVNAKGGINKHKIEFSVVDAGGSNPTAQNAAQKAISLEPDVIIGLPISTQSYAIESYVTKAGIPTIVSGTNAKLAAQSQWMFDMIPTDAVSSTAQARFAVEKLGFKKLALMHGNDEYGTGSAKIARETAEKLGAKVVSDQSHTLGDKDVTAQLRNIKNSDAEVLLVASDQGGIAIILKQAYELGLKMPRISHPIIPPTMKLLAKGAVEDIYIVVKAVPGQSKDPKVQDWVKRFEKRWGKPADEYAAIGYDGGLMVIDAVGRGGASRAGIRDALLATKNFQGIAGRHTSDKDGNLSHFGAIVRVKDKEQQIIEFIDATPQ